MNTALDAGVRKFIFSSTCAVYGVPEKMPITEDTPRQPVNPYGTSKLFFENALEAYDRAYGLRYMSLRYFNAAGADESGEIGELHDPETHLIPAALKAVTGERGELELFGSDYPTPDGTCVRDYIHVNDLADAHVLALKKIEAGSGSAALNLGTGLGCSVKEVITMVEEVTGSKVPRRVGTAPTGGSAHPRRRSVARPECAAMESNALSAGDRANSLAVGARRPPESAEGLAALASRGMRAKTVTITRYTNRCWARLWPRRTEAISVWRTIFQARKSRCWARGKWVAFCCRRC